MGTLYELKFSGEKPANHGLRWTVEDMWLLATLYQQPITWRSIADELKRTVPACQIRMRMILLAYDLLRELEPESIMEKLAGGRKIHKKE